MLQPFPVRSILCNSLCTACRLIIIIKADSELFARHFCGQRGCTDQIDFLGLGCFRDPRSWAMNERARESLREVIRNDG